MFDYLGGPSWFYNREAKESESRQAHVGLVALEVRLQRARPAVDGRPAGSASALWVAGNGTCVPTAPRSSSSSARAKAQSATGEARMAALRTSAGLSQKSAPFWSWSAVILLCCSTSTCTFV